MVTLSSQWLNLPHHYIELSHNEEWVFPMCLCVCVCGGELVLEWRCLVLILKQIVEITNSWSDWWWVHWKTLVSSKLDRNFVLTRTRSIKWPALDRSPLWYQVSWWMSLCWNQVLETIRTWPAQKSRSCSPFSFSSLGPYGPMPKLHWLNLEPTLALKSPRKMVMSRLGAEDSVECRES